MTVDPTKTQSATYPQTLITPSNPDLNVIIPDFIKEIFSDLYKIDPNNVSPRSLDVIAHDDNFNQVILDKLQALGFSNTLEDLFWFPEQAEPFEKIDHIITTIENYTNKSINNLIEDYKDFYYTNILRFWQNLPGGKEFLESEDIQNLSAEEKVAKFHEWISNPNNTANVTTLIFNIHDLAFLSLELNEFSNLEIISAKNSSIQIVSKKLHLPKLKTLNLPFVKYISLDNNKESEAVDLLKKLEMLPFINTLKDIFYFPPNATPFKKIQHIINTIVYSTKRPIRNLLEDYKNFYYTNILKFWQKLPGGKEFLESEDIQNLSAEEKVKKFQNWLTNNKTLINDEQVTELNLEYLDLAFLPLEINELTNLEIISAKGNPIQVIPERLNLPNLKYIETTQEPMFSSKFDTIVSL